MIEPPDDCDAALIRNVFDTKAVALRHLQTGQLVFVPTQVGRAMSGAIEFQRDAARAFFRHGFSAYERNRTGIALAEQMLGMRGNIRPSRR